MGDKNTPQNPPAQSSQDVKMLLWREIRAAIIHEDDLVNHRSTWLLTFEGFLIAGFFLVQTTISKPGTFSHPRSAEFFLLLVLIGGLWMCKVTNQTVQAAYQHVSTLREFWCNRYPEESWPISDMDTWSSLAKHTSRSSHLSNKPIHCQYPPIHGNFKYSLPTRIFNVSIVLMLINLLAAISCVILIFIPL